MMPNYLLPLILFTFCDYSASEGLFDNELLNLVSDFTIAITENIVGFIKNAMIYGPIY